MYPGCCQIDHSFFFLFCRTETLPIKQLWLISASPSPWQSLWSFLFLWIWVPQVPCVSRIIQHLSLYDWLVSLRIMSSRFIMLEHVLGFYSFLKLNNIPLYIFTTFWLFIHLLMDIRVSTSTSWFLYTALLWTLVCKYLFKILFSILMGIYPEVELLDPMVVFTFWGTCILISTGLYHFTISQTAVGFQFLPIFTNTCYFGLFFFPDSIFLWRKKWQPIPVLLPGKSHGQGDLVGYSPWGHERVGHAWSDLAAMVSF